MMMMIISNFHAILTMLNEPNVQMFSKLGGPNYAIFAQDTGHFYRGSKSAKFGLNFQHHPSLCAPHFEMEQDIWNLKQTWWAEMMALCPLQVWWSSVHTPLKTVWGFGLPLKMWLWKCAKSSITQLWIVWFCTDLDTRRPKYYKSSRS